jgi:ABC-type glycerol-3-phosphate transport system substrate-binding protein
MKKRLVAILAVATFVLGACGGGGPNLDDPKSVAAHNCKKMKEMMELIKDPAANSGKLEAIAKEMQKLEDDFKKHHGDNASEMEGKVEEAIKTECGDIANAF